MDNLKSEREMGMVIAKLDAIYSMLANFQQTSQDHETRIRALEKMVWKASAIAGGAGAGGGLLLKLLIDVLGGY